MATDEGRRPSPEGRHRVVLDSAASMDGYVAERDGGLESRDLGRDAVRLRYRVCHG